MGAKNIPGDSKNALETLFLDSKIVNFNKREQDEILINQITKIGEIFITLHKMYMPSPKSPLLINPP